MSCFSVLQAGLWQCLNHEFGQPAHERDPVARAPSIRLLVGVGVMGSVPTADCRSDHTLVAMVLNKLLRVTLRGDTATMMAMAVRV